MTSVTAGGQYMPEGKLLISTVDFGLFIAFSEQEYQIAWLKL